MNSQELDARTIRAREKYEGKIFDTIEKTRQFEVVKFNSGSDILIHFIGSDLYMHTSSYCLGKGIHDPFLNYQKRTTVYFEDAKRELMGNQYRTNQGYVIKVIDVDSKKRVTYQFLDQYGYIGITSIQNIRKGEVGNPYHQNQFGGYIGVGPYNCREYKWVYAMWSNMLMRCNDEYYAVHHKLKGINQVYNAMIADWKCYNTFASWYIFETSKLNPKYQMQYVMNKDLLYPEYKFRTAGNKFYSPQTILLMPDDLNTSIINSNYIEIINPVGNANFAISCSTIIDRAEFYHKENAIDDRTYEIIMRCFKPGGRSYKYR